MKLFTIGDSISQGFMSLAAARTELSYSSLIARCLGLTPGVDYAVPAWGAGGMPINLESLLRNLERRFGNDIDGIIEWPLAIAAINDMLDTVEDYYERGPGNVALPQAGATAFYPNLSIAGYTIADAWKVTPRWCLERITSDAPRRRLFSAPEDGFFALPDKFFERTAHAVLNPSRNPEFHEFSQLEWLRFHANREGIENVVLWLGSNNALGTVVRMRVSSTAAAPQHPLQLGVDQRNQYNLWTPEHFADEFDELMQRVHEILSHDNNQNPNCRVLVATVPAVTIAPLAKGVGSTHSLEDPFKSLPAATYYDNYTYMVFDQDYARRGNGLSLKEMYAIDQNVAAYNQSIKDLVQKYNNLSVANARGPQYVLVDISNELLRLAFKRNNGNPPYEMPPEVITLAGATGRPVPNTVYYHVDRRGRMLSGGVFSLDGVHPTAIGHGLLAHEFLKGMQAHGVQLTRGLDWSAIFASDSLFSRPMAIMEELYDNTKLAEMLLDLLSLP